MTHTFYNRMTKICMLGFAVMLVLILGPRFAAVAQTPAGYCDDSLHDPTRWHPAVDPVTGCRYGHQHGANPVPSGSPFQPLVFAGDEATPNENHYKHNGYIVLYVHRNNRNSMAPTPDPCDDVRVRIHMDVTPLERSGQFHSFEAAIAHCANGQMDVSYIQGWMDFGTVVNLSVREGGDNGVRPNKFAPGPNDFAANGLNIWETWYGRSGIGVDMGWLMGNVPTLAHDGSNPQDPSTWHWTGGAGAKRKLENFNFYGWRETRRGEFWTDPHGNSVDPNSAACRNGTTQCMRQYISPLFGRGPTDQIIINLSYDSVFDATGINYPETFPVTGAHLPWWNGQASTPVPTTPPTSTPVSPTPAPTQPPPAGPAVVVGVNPSTANPGASVAVTLQLLNVNNLYGLQSECTVNPAVLAGASVAGGDGFNDTNSYFVDSGYDAANGTWLVAATRLQPNTAISGNAVAYTLNYTVQGAGSTSVNCTVLGVDSSGHELPLQVVNGSFGSGTTPPPPTQPPPTATFTPTTPPPTPAPPTETPEVEPAGTISGVAGYQNAPDNAGIQVELLANGAAVATTVTSADGAFTFNNVAAGAYTVEIDAPLHLAVTASITVDASGQPVDLGTITLVAGDTDDDGDVDVTDATFVGANFDAQVPPAPANADVNRDLRINISDLVLVGSNYNQVGPIAME
jgi:hypothetical protein